MSSHDAAPPRIGLVRSVLFLVVVAVAFVLLAEALLRVASWTGVLAVGDATSVRADWKSQGWQLDRDLQYTLVPGHSLRLTERDYPINSLGLRDDEIEAKRPGELRIVSIGDSTVFGYGVDPDENFSVRLEQLFAERDVEVINAGVPGYSLHQAFAFLRRDLVDLDPDLVIVESSFNDRRYVPSPEYADSDRFFHSFYDDIRTKEFLDHSYLYRVIRSALARMGVRGASLTEQGRFSYPEIDLRHTPARVEPERYRQLLLELIEFCRARGIDVVLVPLRDSTEIRRRMQRAERLAARGEFEEAVAVLERLRRRHLYHWITAANLKNELHRQSGHHGRQALFVEAVPTFLDSTGGPGVHTSDTYADLMYEVGEETGVAVVEPQPPESLRDIYMDEIHLSAAGHQRLARRLHRAIVALLSKQPGAGGGAKAEAQPQARSPDER